MSRIEKQGGEGGLKPYIAKFLKYRGLLVALVERDLKTRYRRSVLGYIWSVLNPLLMMVVLTIVFSQLFKSAIPNFPIYLLSGQLIFNFFSEATNTSLTSIIDSASLIKKVAMPKYIFPLSRVFSAFVNLLFSLIAIVIVMAATRTPVTWAILQIPLPLFYILLLAIGMGLILSAMAVYFRDMVHLYGILLTIVMYFTPLFYPVEVLPRLARFLIKFNPLFHVVEAFRMCVLYGEVIPMRTNLVCLVFGISSILIGVTIFKRVQDNFILYI